MRFVRAYCAALILCAVFGAMFVLVDRIMEAFR